MGLMDRHRPSDGEWDQCSRLDIVGFDDISLKKGHRNFVTISTGRLDTATVIHTWCVSRSSQGNGQSVSFSDASAAAQDDESCMFRYL